MTSDCIQICGVIITVLGSTAAAISAFYSAKSSRTTLELYKKEKFEKLNDELNNILEIGIQYPYLESKPFTTKWNDFKDSNDERYLRYDMYCNLIFNYLHHVCVFFNYDKKSIEEFVDVKTWIRIHKLNWLHPIDENENIDGYDEHFRQFVNSYVK
ncbi:MAG: hypothetical protein NTW49_13945 [Bacteroidia bacterium]|nr:hypothetical protein [Bacteroidia bacterium]